MYGRATEATAGTGLTTNQFIEAMKQMGGYGIKSETQALNMTQNQALWSRFTGTDLSTIQKYAGQSYRYGGDTGAVSTAYGGLMAQNMGKGQFSEFLNSMSRILEEGIAKGFVRSSEEIAGNMAMLYKLSGNSSLWQGEQGAQRLSQMNMAISNATNLQSVEDVISFGAARDMFDAMDRKDQIKFLEGSGEDDKGGRRTGTYVDYMQVLERGVDPALLQRQFDAVKGLEGGNIAGMIERFRNMYGLNYTGAAQVWDMSRRMGEEGFSAEEISQRIEALKTDPRTQSDSEKLQTVINRMTDNLANIGKFKFDETDFPLLEKQANNVAAILAELRGEIPSPVYNPRDEIIEYTRDDLERNGGSLSEREKQFIMLGAHVEKRKNVMGFQISNALTSLSGGETDGDANAQIAGRNFNRIVPNLLLQENPSDNLLDLIYNIQQEYATATSGITASRRRIDDTELEKINKAIDALANALSHLDTTVNKLSTEGLTVNGDMNMDL